MEVYWLSMKRILGFVGLVIVTIYFAGMTILGVVALILHRHLSLPGWAMLLLNGFSAWYLIRHLRYRTSA
jgi:hypothetical protein